MHERGAAQRRQRGLGGGGVRRRRGPDVHVVMPRDVPDANQVESRLYGAQTILVDGLINDAGAHDPRAGAAARLVRRLDAAEPYRQEGKKTMGIELAEQLGWHACRT